ncbi:hypothetical protein [Bacillus sp. FJAT-45350]|uniref:hypothetical protein n=1 Tax=Bacillus sp. FJAT-45350 TaxID=2011014 RepID=UPI0015CEB3D8|nr:hypothetical protein [Bacillus sp. FJAT-45350]
MKKARNDSYQKAEKEYYDDVDRMINEGLGGGTVDMKDDSGIIEEAPEIPDEEPPPHKA